MPGPIQVELSEGKNYAYCDCKLSQNKPFCDGSHTLCNTKPIIFKSDETTKAMLCSCGYSKNKPFCDGSHALLNKEEK